MKNLNTLFLAASSLFLLVGCGPKKEEVKQLTASEFNERLTKIEKHVYKSATIHATEDIRGTGDFAQDRHEERTEEYTYYPDTDAWIVEHGDSLLRRYIYNFDSLASFKDWLEDEELSYSYKFYSNLTVEVKETGTYTEDMMGVVKTVTIDSNMTIKINEHGYLSSLEGTYEQDITQTASGTTYRGTKSGESSISVTYK